jgi:hypothetical protein
MSLPSPSHSRRGWLAILPALALLAASIFSACSRASSNTLAVENANGARLSKTVFTEKQRHTQFSKDGNALSRISAKLT